MDYGEILSNAWQTVWKHKVLWLFGLLASCTAQGGGQVNYRLRGNASNPPPQLEHFFNQLQPWQLSMLIAVIVTIVFLLLAISIAASAIGRAGLIKGTSLSLQRSEALSLREVWENAKPYFWRIVGMDLLIALVVLLFFMLLSGGIALVALVTLGIGLLCLLPFICLSVPILLLGSVFVQQAQIALVLDDLGIREALHSGWRVFSENIGEMIVMGLILVLGGGVLSFIIGVPLLIGLAPIIIAIATQSPMTGNALLLSALCLVPYLPVLLLARSILVAFIQSAWTLTYMELHPTPSAGQPLESQPLTGGI